MRALILLTIFALNAFVFGASNMEQSFQSCNVKLQKALQANLKTLGYSINLPIDDESVRENVYVILNQIYNFCEYIYLDKALRKQDGLELENNKVSELLRRDLTRVGYFFKDDNSEPF